MADKIIKINLPNTDCKNIYFVNNDELFGGKEITKALTYISRDINLGAMTYTIGAVLVLRG